MNQPEQFETAQDFSSEQTSKRRPRVWINIILFILTFFTTVSAGIMWAGKDPFDLLNFPIGLPYAIALIFVLAAHEFGHYFASRAHGVDATLPYFIPFPMLPMVLNFGTLGAIIRTRSVVTTRKAMFDIGIAGPLSGFIVCVGILIYGFLTLPPPEFILTIHPNYNFVLNTDPTSQGLLLSFGDTLIYSFLKFLFTNPVMQYVPPMTEIYHYPFLCVGWFGLFVTAMNMIPIGQFDGGHIAYTMFGNKHRIISRIFFAFLIVIGLPAFIDWAYATIAIDILGRTNVSPLPFTQYSWGGWAIWALISYTVVKLDHPPIYDDEPLGAGRVILGYISFAIFIVSFSFLPFAISP